MHSLVVETQGFGNSLTFVITTANANRVHAASVALRLGVHLWIAVHLTSASEKQPSAYPSSETKHVICAKETGFSSFNWIELVVNW